MTLRPTFRQPLRYKPRLRLKKFAPARPRSNRGISQSKERSWDSYRKTRTKLAKHPAADQRESGRRVKHIATVGKHWLSKPAVVYRGAREILNPATEEGRSERIWRTMLMWVRQDGWCCFREYDFCPGRLKLSQATFEHENKRGGGKHDSRLSYFDVAGKEIPLNGAAHLNCNQIAGSRRLPIWHGDNCIFELKGAA